MPSAPSRSVLFRDALSRGLLQRVRPEIRELYNILEVDFHPLSICKKISPILAQIGKDPEMEKYVIPLQQVILTRLFQQLSQVYESVDLKFVNNLAQFPEPFQVTPAMIEKFIMNGCKKGDLAIRLDHVSGILTFDSDVFSSARAIQPGSGGSADAEGGSIQRLQNTPSEIARSQLSRLARTLHITCMYVDPSYNQARLAARDAALARAEAESEREHQENLARRAIIEKRKEEASEALSKKQREEETRRRVRAQQQAELEVQRLRDETRMREMRRLKEEQDRIRRQEVEKQLAELKGGLKIDLKDINIDELDSTAIRNMKLAQLEKDKHERDNKIKITAKRIDHLERAFRREELKHLSKDYEAQRENDLEVYEKNKQITLQEAQEKHKESIALKHRLSRLVKPYDSFKRSITERRATEFEKLRKKAEREFEEEKRRRVRAHHEEKARQREAAEAEERRRLEEQEREEREAAEKAAAEEEKKKALAERRAKAEAERAEREEVARKQMQREEEALARRAAAKKAGGEPFSRPREPLTMERTDSSEARAPPRIPIAPRAGGGGWRERLAAKEAAEREAAARGETPAEPAPSTTTTTTTTSAQEVRRTGYVPPAFRAGNTPRGESPADAAPRTASPANGASKYVPKFREREARSDSRDAASPAAPATTSAAAATEEPKKPAPGRYVPPSMRNKQ